MEKITEIVNYIVGHSSELKNKFTNAHSAPVEFACVFCQNEEEYKLFTHWIEALGKVVERTQSGFTYFLDKPIGTVAGPLRLVKIRKSEIQRPERGDADFNTDYKNFKKRYQENGMFELIKRGTFEMLRLSNPNFDVMTCFSSIPKSKDLGVKL